MAVDSGHSSSYSNIAKISNFDELELEFAKMTHRIKNALINNNTDVGSLIEQLSAISTVKGKKVPLFEANIFEKVKTVEDLWKILRSYWSICDYDMLKYVLEIVNCDEADDIFEEFLSRIDPSILKDTEFILSCREYKGEGLKDHLRVKLRVEALTIEIEEQVKEAISRTYDLEKYALKLKGIKKGCIELIYGISQALQSYLLQFEVTGNDLSYFPVCNIDYLQICDKILKIPLEVTNGVSFVSWTNYSHSKLEMYDFNPFICSYEQRA